MAKKSFNPNKKSFSMCLARLRETSKAVGIDQKKGILTSKHKIAIKAMDNLKVKNILMGSLNGRQLPVYLDGPS